MFIIGETLTMPMSLNIMSYNIDIQETDQIAFDLDDKHPTKLSEGMPDKLVLIDCETTGGKPTYHRIIEIGLIVVENGEITDTWESIINPEQHLPPNIQQLTGIAPNDLRHAPRFKDIADVLLSKLNGRVFTAHNARFDYGFIKNEFSRIGVSYSAKPLCSVKFSRALYPQFKRHGLDNIIKRFGFRIDNRHRAFDDAKVIYDFFLQSSKLFSDHDIACVCDDIMERSTLPTQLSSKVIDELPKMPGVYYFYDAKGKLLYVGKSVNIRNRVLNHFSQDYKNHKDLKMSALIADISYETTASDFSAQLLESQEIKKLKPLFNHRLRKVKNLYRLVIETNESGYAIPVIKQQELGAIDIDNHFGLFRSFRQVQNKLKALCDAHQLCFRLIGLEGKNVDDGKACFRYQLKKCGGACCHQEPPEAYNKRLEEALEDYQQKIWPWPDAILLEEKDNESVSHFHLIKDWVYVSKLKSIDELFDRGYQILKGLTLNEPYFQKNTVYEETECFDLDMYFILIRFLMNPEMMKINRITVHPLASASLAPEWE